MKPAPLIYERPRSIENAVALLAEMEWGARIIAGGQSLVPMLNLRLAPVIKLIDISRLEELRSVRDNGASVTYGACLRHGEFEDGQVTDCTNGLMQRVASRIAYRAIRNRGTIGGSVSLADPSADWITVLIALEAVFDIAGPNGSRKVAAQDMFLGPYTTALGDHDILCSIEVARLSARARTGYYKIIRKAGEYPMTTATVIKDTERQRSNVVLGAANRPQMRLSKCSEAVGSAGAWSRTTHGSLLAAYRADMEDAGRADDPYELKLCETTVLRAAQQALE